MKAWMRVLEVYLTSQSSNNGKARQLSFGTNWRENPQSNELSISITGSKFMSALKDTCKIEISNLSYNEVVKIIEGKFYDVEIKCGYRTGNTFTIFKGGILYISNSLDNTKTNTVIILCASSLVAKYGQSRINLTLNSGINMYTAFNVIAKKAGVPLSTISPQLRKNIISNAFAKEGSAGNWIDAFASTNENLIVNTDESVANSALAIFDASKSNLRVIKMDSKTINLSGGYPQLSSDGLSLTILPTFAFMCGDVIQIDNSLINLPVRSQSEVSRNYGYYLDKDGHYMIYQISYSLQNRDSDFSLNLLCKSRSLISNYLGKY